MTNELTDSIRVGRILPVRVGLVLAAFPREKVAAFKYFLLLLNRLQRTFEFEFHERLWTSR